MDVVTIKNIIPVVFIGFIILFFLGMFVSLGVKILLAGKKSSHALRQGFQDISKSIDSRNSSKHRSDNFTSNPNIPGQGW